MNDHAELEQMLHLLSEELVFPPTPDISERVKRSIPNRRQPRVPGALMAVALIALLLLTPPARAAIQSVFDAVGIEISISDREMDGTDLPLLDESLFGVPVSLEEAEIAFGRPLVIPTHVLPEPPAAIYLLQPEGSSGLTSITMVYAETDDLPGIANTGIGAIFTQMVGSGDQPWLVKTILPSAASEPVSTDVGPGWWIEDGQLGTTSGTDSRVSGHVLIWLSDNRGYRLESGLDRDTSILFAESLERP